MSRMIAWVCSHPLDAREAVGEETLARFLALSALHSDGWGIAGRGDGSAPDLATGIGVPEAGLQRGGETRRSSALLYLRFASAGSAVTPANLQPFLVDDLVFAHNGALSPRSLAFDDLPLEARDELRGTTDSEVYFAHARRERLRDGAAAEAVARAAARMRALYPEACLNAFLLVDDALVVVHSPGAVPPPHAAFAARGWPVDALPPGHGDGYNDLWTLESASGAQVVATNGTLGPSATRLPRDAVVTFAPGLPPSAIPLPT